MVGRCACSPLLREFPRFPLGETAQLPNNLSIIHGVRLLPTPILLYAILMLLNLKIKFF